MLKQRILKSISKILLGVLTISTVISLPGNEAKADAMKVVTLGADLTQQQKDDMLKYFNVKKDEANILEVNITEEKKYLGKIAPPEQLGSKSISSSYVEPTSKGGINVKTNNLYWVTDSMITNALITAGITNATVIASAPFKVSGTAALTGILKGFENSESGKKIDENKKEVANEELVVTGKLGDKIGQDEAAKAINEIKKDVVKEKPKTDKEIEKLVSNVTNSYGSKLSDEDVKNVTSLMSKINGLDLDFKQIKDQLNDVSKKLKDQLNSDEAKGFFSKVKDFFSGMWESISDFFSNLLSSEEKATEEPKTDKNNTQPTNDNNSKNENNTKK
ncbi:DUF1002 domain-containing protein [Clostridium frigidicarnis]|uniref:Uncharacterized protein YpuA, DUF1002 family n=1 Tax=Clostridium frigidicarnis TaxID=84698 RepID=A0A1I0W6X4_9CLOT|nr:DUF1002 domain-containing protein [Clostridium frigidicarnis]SFA83783.1 Uncharacterized protein YpuA, DUF1002 family [Clostridium frigidicarnis]